MVTVDIKNISELRLGENKVFPQPQLFHEQYQDNVERIIIRLEA